MRYLGIDLSGRYSAGVLVDSQGSPMVHRAGDFGSSSVHHSVLVGNMLAWLDKLHADGGFDWADPELTVVIEDTPTRIMNPKPVMRLSGALLGALWAYARIEPLLVAPGVWQKALGFHADKALGRKTTDQRKQYAQAWAAQRGFDVQSLAGLTRKGREDVADAYCIARYGAFVMEGFDGC